MEKIVVCDDDSSRVRTWRDKIRRIADVRQKYEVVALTPEQFDSALHALRGRQFESRRAATTPATGGPGAPFPSDGAAILDDAALVIVDFDLTPRDPGPSSARDDLGALSGSFGDLFCYLARSYSGAAYTVLVNQGFYESTFDLTMCRFNTSLADLNVTTPDLGKTRLWDGQPAGGHFRPWHWPRLVDAADRTRHLAATVDLDAKVLETLKLDSATHPAVFDAFHVEQLDPLGSSPESLTFRDVTELSNSLGRLSDDERPAQRELAKVAVFGVTQWLRRFVLPSQNVIVDAPHLAQRRPGLLNKSDRRQLNRLADLTDRGAVSDVLQNEALDDARATALDQWLDRPVWYWPLCPTTGLGRGGSTEVFCEDVSMFASLDSDDAMEFASDVPGRFKQRFVKKTKEANYRPERRLFTA